MHSIFPIMIWPFSEPSSPDHCSALVEYFAEMRDDRVALPSIVVNNQSRRWLRDGHLRTLSRVEQLQWQVNWVWSVDTCQTWLHALATSHRFCPKRPHVIASSSQPEYVEHCTDCVHLIIPADFHYAETEGQMALSKFESQFGTMTHPSYRMSIGQIHAQESDFKQIVDDCGTWPLVELWFPVQSTVLRRRQIEKPRSEFLALSGTLLDALLMERWFPYTQTLITLLKLVDRRLDNAVHVYQLGSIQEDPPTNCWNEYVTQIERIERALKLYWRDSHDLSKEREADYLNLTIKSHDLMENLVDTSRESFASIHR